MIGGFGNEDYAHTHQGIDNIGRSYQIICSYMENRPTIKRRKTCRATWHHLNHHLHKGDFTTDDINQYLDAMSIMEEYKWDPPLWVPMIKGKSGNIVYGSV